MLIGFASEAIALGHKASDPDVLRELGCERVFSAAQNVYLAEDMLDYLRPGDVLAVTSLSRLGSDLEHVVALLERLHLAGVGILVTGTDIVPGKTLGDAFAKVGAMLAEFARSSKQQATGKQRTRSRGRPIALPPEAQMRARLLLKDGTKSVAEVARVLRVSPATLYRYFPRGSRSAGLETKRKTSHATGERPSSAKR
jgi:DNA invertase Pin-like site-specific DNA recombinase